MKSTSDGHRKRLRDRFLSGGSLAVADYELLELILFAAHPRGDVKPLAKSLLHRFGGLSQVIKAPENQLLESDGMGPASVVAIKIVTAVLEKMMQQEMKEAPVLGSWKLVIDYCKFTMGHLQNEQLRLLFVDRQNRLLADEVQQTGTIDHTPVYTREVIRRALELGASGLIIVHNHPSGDPTPSKADITVTQEIVQAADKLGIQVHDHIIIGRENHVSMRSRGLLG
jgi:DNA repair protein RadC